MRISLHFVWNGERTPAAVTGVEGDVSTILLPDPGDFVEHHDVEGRTISARITHRVFRYGLANGVSPAGEVIVVLGMEKVRLPGQADGH